MQIAERWILARLRHETFFSLAALNARIAELLADLNARPDAPLPRQPPRALRAPRSARPPAAAGRALRLRRVEARPRQRRLPRRAPRPLLLRPLRPRARGRRRAADGATVEIFHRGQRVGAHRRDDTPRPAHHRPRPHAQGPSAPSGVDALADHRAGPGPSARRPPPSSRRSSPTGRIPSRAIARASASCASAKRYGDARLEAACARAVAVAARSYRHVDSILKHGLDRLRSPAPAATPPRSRHEHVRARTTTSEGGGDARPPRPSTSSRPSSSTPWPPPGPSSSSTPS